MRTSRYLRRGIASLLAAFCVLMLPLPLPAQSEIAIDPAETVEVERDGVQLHDQIRDHRPDLDTVDTALVFTAVRSRRTVVKCTGYDDNGHVVGAVRLRVPGRGLRYVLASDISHGRDFVGSVVCKTSGKILPSAVLLGRGITDLGVEQAEGDYSVIIRFPLVVTF